MIRFKKDDGSNYPDWEEKKLGEALTIYHGKDYKHLENGNIPVYGTGGIITYVDKFLCDWECVCIGRKGTIDKPLYISTSFWNVDTLFATKTKVGHNAKFQYYLFETIKWKKYNEASGVPSLSASTIENIKYRVPCLEEQQKIADFLSSVDDIISASEKEVANLEEQKKGVMQKIFSREVRFKADDGSDYPQWEEKGFYDIFELFQNNTFSRDMLNYENGNVQNVHYGDVLVKFGSVLDCNKKKLPFINDDIPVSKFSNESYVKNGDVILADTAEDFSAGKVTEIKNVENKKILSGLHTMLCRPKEEFATGFLGYYLNSNTYHKQVIPLLVGTKVYSINKKVIGRTNIKIPCIEEQQKIANFLSDIDTAIEKAKAELECWKEIKKGLLQQLFI